MRFTVGKKITAGFSLIILLSLVGFVSNLWVQNQMSTSMNEISHKKDELILMQRVNYLIRSADDDGAWYLLSSSLEGQKKFFSQYQNNVKTVTNEISVLKQSQLNPEGITAIKEFENQWDKYLKANEEVFAIFKQGEIQKAQSTYTEVPFEPIIESLISYQNKLNVEIKYLENKIATFKSFVSKFNIGVILVTVILGIFIALIISRRIVKPLLQVSKQVKEIAEGEADLTKEILVSSKDEIGDLALYFNQMLRNLRSIMKHIGHSAEQVASSSEQLSASSQQTSKATEQITYTMQEVATGTDKQVVSLDQNVTTIQEISKGIQQIAESIQDVSSSSHQSAEAAKVGNDAILDAIGQMQTTNRSIHSLSDVVKGFHERSTEISQIISVITGIASQTNLLALNASIEAARAGDHGRGFAVVANEVKKLAEQSANSASQITQLVHAIQNDTNTIIQSMHTTMNEVNQGSTSMDKAGVSFEIIQRAIIEVSGQVQEVSAAVEQIAASSEEVTDSIRNVSHISKHAAAEIQVASSATEEQLASMEEISASSNYLSQMAEELQSLVGKFKV
ncbi:methyl-accepting chemotaxis protein [Paenibacillus sp. Soil787]|uniref:methyl-accepting chemotaxis protein n=1 Tax=Paenibacillus sp. Soil787 TaxID=1736411 RepID=UPI0007039C0C|nr:HAMP domain-containing methyl-accepting chemotaxis protein [Paenibacillus sp. Soil787]KRF12252.1 hypothetical protein ASG93_15725 [Paenibacillus sp. Soil787]